MTLTHPAFVTAVYGTKYAAFLAPHLESIRAACPAHAEQRGTAFWHDLPRREIDTLTLSFPEFEFAELRFAAGSDVMHAIPRKLVAWLEGARRYPDRPVCFLDCDAVLLRPLDDLFADESWDVIYTWKDEVFPINTGVMLARRGDVIAPVFERMLARVEQILADKGAMATAVGASGAADQHALREIIGFCNYDASATREVAGRRIAFRGVPCRVLNETNCRAIDPDLRVIHYKTGWHPILLDRAPFTKNRPQDACAAMFRHWHELEDRTAAAVAHDVVLASARAARDRFATIAGGYEERGILHSEMLAVCGTCQRLGVEVVIESGRCRGQSTLVLSRFFENTPTRVVSIELARDENAEFAEPRLAPYAHTELLYGDSTRLLPQLLHRFRGQRIAILLDGPKGLPALDLVERCFADSPDVCAAFVHDTRKSTPQRDSLADRPLRAFCTDDDAYVAEFGALDHTCLPADDNAITVHTWRPFRKGLDTIPSYGPTLAVLFPRPARAGWTRAEARRTA